MNSNFLSPFRFVAVSICIMLAFENLWAQSGLKVSHSDSVLIIAEFNGIRYDEPAATFFFHPIAPGQHQLKVFKLMQLGNSFVHQPIYEGTVNVQPNATTVTEIDRFNQLRYVGREPVEVRNQDNRNMQQRPWRPNPANIQPETTPYTTREAMNNLQWQQQIELLRAQPSENARMQSARSLVSLYTFNSHQLADAMLTLERESNRMDLAVIGFDYVTDRQNFRVVYNTLRSPNSIRKVERRIQRKEF